MAYYKYIPRKRFASLHSGLIRFTQPGAFNDPFEMPAFKAEEAEAVRRAGLAGLMGQTGAIMRGLMAGRIPEGASIPPILYWTGQVGAPAPRRPDPVPSEEAIERIRRIDETFGILSLAGSADNLLLWVHYADEHRGLAVEIDVEDPAFTPSSGGGERFQLAAPVRYVGERPRIPETNEILFEHFFVKSPEWAYEREFRIVRRLASAVETIAAKPYPVHLFPLPPSAIRQVIFGARVTAETRHRLIARARSEPQFRHVGFAQVTLDPRQFRVEIGE